MQQTFLLTLQGPQRRLDLELPGDVTVSDLLPLLRQLCGDPADNGKWSLSRQVSGKPLQAALTLLDNKVLDGDVLVLHKEGAPPGARPARRQAEPVTRGQSGSIVITWEK